MTWDKVSDSVKLSSAAKKKNKTAPVRKAQTTPQKPYPPQPIRQNKKNVKKSAPKQSVQQAKKPEPKSNRKTPVEKNGVRLKSEVPFYLMGLFLLTLIALVILFPPFDDVKKQPAIGKVFKNRVADLEKKINALDAIEDRISTMETQLDKITSNAKKTTQEDNPVTQRLKKIEADMQDLTSEIQQIKSNALKKDATIKKFLPEKKPAKISEPSSRSNVGKSKEKNVASTPKIHIAKYHLVKKGENTYSISRKHGISIHELRRLNHLKPGATIYPGQRLIIKK